MNVTAVTDFVFRHAGGCLLETPDLHLPCPADVESWSWVATLWRDRHSSDGWAALEWRPGERGWIIPATTALGDIVEFGTGAADAEGCPRFDRWWGWIPRISHCAIVVAGPFEHPLLAHHDACALVDELRLSQLDEPDVISAIAALLGPNQLG